MLALAPRRSSPPRQLQSQSTPLRARTRGEGQDPAGPTYRTTSRAGRALSVLPDSLPATPSYLHAPAPAHALSPGGGGRAQQHAAGGGSPPASPPAAAAGGSSSVGLVDEGMMRSAFTELKGIIADMDAQLEQFEFVLDHMRSNMVRINDEGTMEGAFDEDDVEAWQADADKVLRVKQAYESDFGKRIHMYERKVQDASGVVRRRMDFFNDVNDRFNLLRKRPELMRRMARKQAELISTLAETQRVLLRDMRAAVSQYRRDVGSGERRRLGKALAAEAESGGGTEEAHADDTSEGGAPEATGMLYQHQVSGSGGDGTRHTKGYGGSTNSVFGATLRNTGGPASAGAIGSTLEGGDSGSDDGDEGRAAEGDEYEAVDDYGD